MTLSSAYIERIPRVICTICTSIPPSSTAINEIMSLLKLHNRFIDYSHWGKKNINLKGKNISLLHKAIGKCYIKSPYYLSLYLFYEISKFHNWLIQIILFTCRS